MKKIKYADILELEKMIIQDNEEMMKFKVKRRETDDMDKL